MTNVKRTSFRTKLAVAALLATVAGGHAMADVTTESFPAFSLPAGSPGIENFQHDRFSGAVAYTVPLEVAPGTNGVQPTLALRYFSGGGNSTVGNGWSIDLGRISRSTRLGKPLFNDDDLFILQLNDMAAELVKIAPGQYRTKQESHLRITKTGNFWLVEDRNGFKYEFAYSTENQFNNPGLYFYLTKMTDPNGNFIELTYTNTDTGNQVAYLDRITYTKGNGAGNFRTVEFTYETRTDNYPDLSTGKDVRYVKRVDFVDVRVAGSLYKRYNFTYAYAAASQKSLLTRVDEIGSDQSSTLKLAEFQYGTNAITVASPSPIANPSPVTLDDTALRVGDVNVDGYPDLVKTVVGQIQVVPGTGSGWGPVVTYPYGFITSDYTSNKPSVRLGDVNGDGRDDIVRSDEVDNLPLHYYVLYNNGNGWDAPVLIGNSPTWDKTFRLKFPYVHLADVNGDRRVDIVQSRLNATTGNVDIYVGYGTGSGWSDPQQVISGLDEFFHLMLHIRGGNRQCAARLEDINGDGMADLIASRLNTTTQAFEFAYMLANGTSWDGAARPLPLSSSFVLNFSATKVTDLNKDGFPDLISARNISGTISYKYVLGNGNGFGAEQTLANPPPWITEDRTVFMRDVDRDGIVDVFNSSTGTFAGFRLTNPQDELLLQVTNRFGGRIAFEYKSPKDAGNSSFPFSLAVLSAVTRDPGAGLVTGTTRYQYDGGSYDVQNRIFRGFQHVTTTDPLAFISQDYFHQDDSRLGKRERSDRPSQLITYAYEADSSAPYFTPVSQVDECNDSKCRRTTFSYDAFGNTIRQTEFGDLAESGDERTVLTDYAINSSSWLVDRPSRQRIFPNTDGSGAALRETQTLYDNNASYADAPSRGNPTKVRRYLDTKADYVNELAAYDAYGNVISRTDANQRTTSMVYDPQYFTFPITVTHPVTGIIDRFTTYMPGEANGLFGRLKSRTDPNGNQVNFEYDVFGRRTKEIGPLDGASTYGSESYEYGIGSPGASFVRTRTTEQSGTAGHRISVDLLDGFERVIQKAQESEDPNTFSYVTTNYNGRGEVDRVSLPLLRGGGVPVSYQTPTGSERWMTNTYDALGRITRITKPDASITHSYAGWTTTTADENNHTKVFTNDAYGRLKVVIERNQGADYTTAYLYDRVGNLTQITDHMGNPIQFEYDSLERKTRVIDRDLGTWTYLYDDAGNMTRTTDARGVVINFSYDALNRMTTKDFAGSPGIEVTHTYDEPASSQALGRRSSMTDLSGSSRWHYDQEGRTVRLEKVVTGQPYLLEWTYDALDRVTSVKYPTGEIVTATFNNAGLVETIPGYVSGASYDAAGQPLTIDFANGVATTATYFPENLRPQRIITGSLQDLQYAYDGVGNVRTITDVVHGWTKTYTYDDLDRLLSGDGQTYTYNAIGNILTRTGLTYQYGTRPHAVTDDGASAYDYDACGNMLSGAGRVFTYTAENRPAQITANGATTSLTYDGDGNRVKKVVTGTPDASTTDYVAGLYEKEFGGTSSVNILSTEIVSGSLRLAFQSASGVTYTVQSSSDLAAWSTLTTVAGTGAVVTVTDPIGTRPRAFYRVIVPAAPVERSFIMMNGRRVAVKEGAQKHFFHNDHLGSTSLMTNASGQQVKYIDYRPFGDTAVETGSLAMSKKFTGKELDSSTGLYDYGARQYDAKLGRFTSADSVIPDLRNPQALNRYSYVYNNPLKYIDPTGHAADYVTYDFVAFVLDLQAFNEEPSFLNGVALGLDAVLYVAPFVPAVAGLGIRGMRAAAAAADAAGTGKAAVVEAGSQSLRSLEKSAASGTRNTETVQRAMSRKELKATEDSGFLRGGKIGTPESPHFVGNSINSRALRARQRLALPQTPEVRVTMEVPAGTFSKPTKVGRKHNMPGGGEERTATGLVPARVLRSDEMR